MCEEYAEACRVARATSEPSRAVAKQCFMLFPRIRELDRLLTPELAERIIETHPEVAFAELNGGAPMGLPKTVKNRTSASGLDERRALLERFGFAPDFLLQPVPRGASADDLLDACVAALVAKRHLQGIAISHPNPPGRDARGLPVAIWA
jgi:predicted RNase H-like nuclease